MPKKNPLMVQVVSPDRAVINKLSKRLTKVINRFMEQEGFVGKGTEPADHLDGVRLAFAAVSEVLGLLDVPAHLYGVPMAERSREMRAHWRNGRIRALKAHDQTCPGCDAADELRQELAGS
jgi:hypothetical protein